MSMMGMISSPAFHAGMKKIHDDLVRTTHNATVEECIGAIMKIQVEGDGLSALPMLGMRTMCIETIEALKRPEPEKETKQEEVEG